MYSNHVWEHVEPPVNIKSIGCKWIYKRQRGPVGLFETFKLDWWLNALLKRKELIMKKYFNWTPCLKSILVLLSIAIHFDYKIWQMDIKTAFLNANLEEDIYMMKPK